jgi:hypothetical protein
MAHSIKSLVPAMVDALTVNGHRCGVVVTPALDVSLSATDANKKRAVDPHTGAHPRKCGLGYMAAIDRAIKDTAQIAFGCSLGELGDISKHVAGPMVAELFTFSGGTISVYGNGEKPHGAMANHSSSSSSSAAAAAATPHSWVLRCPIDQIHAHASEAALAHLLSLSCMDQTSAMFEEQARAQLKGHFVDADTGSLQLMAEYSALQSKRSLAGHALHDDEQNVANRKHKEEWRKRCRDG